MFYLVHAGGALKVLTSAGAVHSTLTLPTGVTLSDTRPAQFAILARRVIITNAPSKNLWLDPLDMTLHVLGLTAPASAPTAAAGAGTGLTGNYSAIVTFVHKSGGELVNESPASDVSNTIALANQSFALSGIPVSTDPDVNCRRLYRNTAGDEGTWLFLADIDDNSTTTYDGSVPDADLGDELPDLGNAPAGTVDGTYLTLITEWKSRLWARAEGVGLVDRLFYTEVGLPWAWFAANDLPIPSLGEDATGITALMRRRDELGVGRRQRVVRVVGNTRDDFQVVIVSEETGVLAPRSVVIIRDEAHFLGVDGVYKFGPEGVVPLSRDQVEPYFLTDTYFNRGAFADAIGGYNALNDTYDLHLAPVGSSELTRWVSYHARNNWWSGPHLTAAFTPSARVMFRDANDAFLPIMGGTDGFLYLMNRTLPSDYAGAAPSTPIAISIDWLTNYMHEGAPDLTKVWRRPTIHLKKQGASAGDVTVTSITGSLEGGTLTLGTTFSQALTQRFSRVVLMRLGVGNFAQLQYTHAIAEEDVELYLLELPVSALGRR